MSQDTLLDNFMGAGHPAPDTELEELLYAHAWLATLEPFSIDWELVWFM